MAIIAHRAARFGDAPFVGQRATGNRRFGSEQRAASSEQRTASSEQRAATEGDGDDDDGDDDDDDDESRWEWARVDGSGLEWMGVELRQPFILPHTTPRSLCRPHTTHPAPRTPHPAPPPAGCRPRANHTRKTDWGEGGGAGAGPQVRDGLRHGFMWPLALFRRNQKNTRRVGRVHAINIVRVCRARTMARGPWSMSDDLPDIPSGLRGPSPVNEAAFSSTLTISTRSIHPSGRCPRRSPFAARAYR